MSDIPTGAAPLPQPPPNEGAVSFKTGGLQTWKKEAALADNLYPATVKSWKRTTSTFGGQNKEQFAFLLTVDGREADGELCFYTGINAVHPKSKLPPFLRAIGRRVPTPDNPTLPDGIPGAKCKVLVKNEAGQDGVVRPKVKDVLAA